MSEMTAQIQSTRFKIGRGILLFFAAANVLGHIGLHLFVTEGVGTLFLSWAAFNFLAAAILLIPYRRVEMWAWYTIWAMVILYASVILLSTDVGVGRSIYLGEALLMALGQVLTYRTFFSKGPAN